MARPRLRNDQGGIDPLGSASLRSRSEYKIVENV